MQKLFLSLFLLATMPAGAQTSGIYLQIAGGGHITSELYSQGGNTGPVYSSGVQGGLTVGYSSAKWQFETGLSLLQHVTKTADDHFKFEDEIDPLTGNIIPGKHHDVLLYQKSTHICLPLTIKYALLDHRFRLSPILGIMIGYHTGYKIRYSVDGSETPYTNPENYSIDVPKISFWGVLGIEACYNLSKRSSVIITPKASYMLNGYQIAPDEKVHTMMFGADLGYRLYLARR